MHQFFIKPDSIIKNDIFITDSQDVSHIRNVLRMKKGEKVSLCCQETGREYICRISSLETEEVRAEIEDVSGQSRELPVRITLFQSLPKGDKMEWIIQKAVELGASEIVPVASKRAVVRLDEKKAEKKLRRWREIARNAAAQSRRTVLPEVSPVMSFSEAVDYGKGLGMLFIPYEEARGIADSRRMLSLAKGKESLGIYIGPEGGFQEEEVALAAQAGACPITLGHRILRTETAAMSVLSILMFMLEEE